MRRALTILAATFALAGCVNTGYHRDGSVDYYYERDNGPDRYYVVGPGYASFYGFGFGLYDPFWAARGYYGAGTPWGYDAYYNGWTYWPWYNNPWYGGNFYDWSRWQQEEQARARTARVRGESAAIAAMPRDMPAGSRAEGGQFGASSRLSGADRLSMPLDLNGRGVRAPGRWAGADESRQLRTEAVDPYYGAPRVRRGEAMPGDGQRRLGSERPAGNVRGMNRSPDAGIPDRDSRIIRGGPALRDPGFAQPRRFEATPGAGAPARAPAPQREFAPAPIRRSDSSPAPSFDRAPSFSPRSVPSSAPSRDGGSRTERR